MLRIALTSISLLLIGTLVIRSDALISSAAAQGNSPWAGRWIAEGTLFQISVTVDASRLEVQQVESLGFSWGSEIGEIDGDIALVPVSYAGVSGIVQAQLLDANTAIVFAASCMPEFMVVCALAKDRQAVFRKVTN